MQSRFGTSMIAGFSSTLLALILGCGVPAESTGGGAPEAAKETDAMTTTQSVPAIDLAAPQNTRTATFALG